jgi:ABC-type Fe3+-hydroxamate transport system substrate-binding protein
MLTGKLKKAEEIITGIETNFSKLPARGSRPRTTYFIWEKPYMTVGADTFIHSMLAAAGFENVFKHTTRYPEVTMEDLQIANCQLLLLSSEPFPFKQKHVDELKHHLPHSQVLLVDGEMFSWYGSRLLQAPAYFNKLFSQLMIHNS